MGVEELIFCSILTTVAMVRYQKGQQSCARQFFVKVLNAELKGNGEVE